VGVAATKGQVSPTSVLGFKTKTSPYQNWDAPLNPVMMLLAYGASWSAKPTPASRIA
jgi:2-oxoglutarate ferredoxin oxidoreductase subunit beta